MQAHPPKRLNHKHKSSKHKLYARTHAHYSLPAVPSVRSVRTLERLREELIARAKSAQPSQLRRGYLAICKPPRSRSYHCHCRCPREISNGRGPLQARRQRRACPGPPSHWLFEKSARAQTRKSARDQSGGRAGGGWHTQHGGGDKDPERHSLNARMLERSSWAAALKWNTVLPKR